MNFNTLSICCFILVFFAETRADRLYGLERMERVDLLPNLVEGARVMQVSSRDRNGGNDDGYNTTYSSLYVDENGEHVLFDEQSPGCVYRIWMTFSYNIIDQTILRFYFDGETVPRLETSLRDFYDGNTAPFLEPIVGERWVSSGGLYCYLPFPYAERLKITVSEISPPFYYNMTYHRFDSDENVETWDGTEDSFPVLQMLSAPGVDPKSTSGSMQVESDVFIPNGAIAQIYTNSGPGVVESFRLDLGSFPLDQLGALQLTMNWDGGEPEVSAPVDEFFAYKSGGLDVESFLVGMNSNGQSYCFFPMPFWENADIRIENSSGIEVTNLHCNVQVSSNDYDQAKSGYFHVDRLTSTFGSNGRDYIFLDVEGRGHLVGMSIYMNPNGTSLSYLEGDERIYLDGSLTPAIYGTGAEDYFNCGWYFIKGRVSLPYHGSTYQNYSGSGNNGATLAYRFHLTDVVPFQTSIKAGIEHGANNASAGTYASVAYYYLAPDQPQGLMLVGDLDLADAWSEQLYDYKNEGGLPVSGSWYYEGDDDTIVIADEGYAYNGNEVEFTIPLTPDNAGLLLRRRTDQRPAGQEAYIFVDDQLAGIWYEPDHNFYSTSKRWLDSEFLISSNLVAGKSSATISILPLTSSPQWHEYRYNAFCIMPLKILEDADDDLLPDEWEEELAFSLDVLTATGDADSDGVTDFEEYVAGTDPLDPASVFLLGEDQSVQSSMGRLYYLQECTNLLSDDWITVRSAVPGNGGILQFNEENDKPAVFRRIVVEKP